ncbi:MAG: efflux RND transporter periplasmic adaptor subunit [Candidatus Binatia bacterium]
MTPRGVCASLALAAVLCSGCERHGDPQAVAAEPHHAKAVVPVTVAPVAVHPSARLVRFVGTLYGNEEVTLSSQVEGQVESLAVDLGDPVHAGQVLAQIDDDQWRAQLREAEATLAKAQADEKRDRQLVARHVISRQEYETMTTRVAVARAQRDRLAVMIRHARVASPLTGAVARRFVSAGEYVHAGSQLFKLVAEDPLKLRGDVPERFAHELRAGQVVHLHVDASPALRFTGRLVRISPASNQENRSVAIEALVDNRDRRLKPGFFANAAVVTRTDDRALLVPQEALTTSAGVTKVFVISAGVAHARHVQPGPRSEGGLVEVTGGLTPDELVATSGLTKLGDGVAVIARRSGVPHSDPGS